ncbi:MAG: ARMT1-like domain-containing protein [Candidatus Omnitrophota bacterium]
MIKKLFTVRDTIMKISRSPHYLPILKLILVLAMQLVVVLYYSLFDKDPSFAKSKTFPESTLPVKNDFSLCIHTKRIPYFLSPPLKLNKLKTKSLKQKPSEEAALKNARLQFESQKPIVKTFDDTNVEIALVVEGGAFDLQGESRFFFDRVRNKIILDGTEIPFAKISQVSAMRIDVDSLVAQYKAEHPDYEILAVLPNGNLGFNEWFIAINNSIVYHISNEPLLGRNYDMLVTQDDGRVLAMTVKFFNSKGEQGIFDEQDLDISNKIKCGVYGQRIVKNGKLNIEALYEQFDDLRHLFRFPMFQRGTDQFHLGFSDGVGELYNDKEKIRQALQDKPVTLSLSPLRIKGISDEERELVFTKWGYKNVTEEKDIPLLKGGEYIIDTTTDTVTVVFLPGIHPHTCFGVTRDGKIITSAVTGITHFKGATLLDLANALIQQGAQDIFLWANGKDTFMQIGTETIIEADGCRRNGLEVLLVVHKKQRIVESVSKENVVDELKFTKGKSLGFASRGQVAMGEIWDGGIGRWLDATHPDSNLSKFYAGIQGLPINDGIKAKLLDRVKARVESEIISKKDIFKPYIKSYAWHVLFTKLNGIYKDCLEEVRRESEEDYQNIIGINPYLDPFYHVKQEENERDVKDIVQNLKKVFGIPDERDRLSMAIEISALGNAIDQFRGQLDEAARAKLFYLIDHRRQILDRLMDPATKRIAICTDNSGEVFSDFILIHALLCMGKEVTIYAKDRPYMVKDVLSDEVNDLIERYDAQLVQLEIMKQYRGLGTYLSSGQLIITTDTFTTSGLEFSSEEGLRFGDALKRAGNQVVILKGEAWVEQLMDVRGLRWSDTFENPWPLDVISLHMGKNASLIFDAPRMPDMNKYNIIIRYAPSLRSGTSFGPGTPAANQPTDTNDVDRFLTSVTSTTEEIIRARFKDRNSICAVDLDTGTGEFVGSFGMLLRKLFDNVSIVGLETLKFLTDQARSNGNNVIWAAPEAGDYEKIGIVDSSYDIVTINNITKTWVLIPQAVRILKPDGILFITIEDGDVVDGLDKSIMSDLEKKGFEVKRFESLPSDYPCSPKFTEGVFLICSRKDFPVIVPEPQAKTATQPTAQPPDTVGVMSESVQTDRKFEIYVPLSVLKKVDDEVLIGSTMEIFQAEADGVHFDVRDKNYFENTGRSNANIDYPDNTEQFTPALISKMKERGAEIPFDVHLLYLKPSNEYLKAFAETGVVSSIDIQFDSFGSDTQGLLGAIQYVKTLKYTESVNVKAGLVIESDEQVKDIPDEILKEVDIVVVTAVATAEVGGKTDVSVFDKVDLLRKRGYAKEIMIQGGIDDTTIGPSVKKGANIFVSGSYVLNNKAGLTPKETIRILREAIKKAV